MKKIIPFPIWQGEWLVRWLNERSREGWKLKRIRMGMAEFEPTTRTRLRYGIFSEAAATDEDLERRKDLSLKELNDEMRRHYEEQGWEYVTKWGSFFLMTQRTYDAALPPDLHEQWQKSRKEERRSTIGAAFTVFSVLSAILAKHLQAEGGWTPRLVTVMVLLGVLLLASIVYSVLFFRKEREGQRPRDVSEEEFQRRLHKAKGLYAMKVCVQLGTYMGLIWSLQDIVARIFTK